MTRYTPADFDTGTAESVPISQRVIRAVAAETDADPLDLDRLFDVVNPESLNALFEPTKRGSSRAMGMVAFQYEGCEVTVHASGEIEVVSSKQTIQPVSQTESVCTD